MSLNIVKNLVSESKYGIKCPYEMTPKFIVVHNTANDASAENEISYMIGNNNEVSFHYAVDDKEVVQGIPTNRNAWHAGDGGAGNGNRNGIAIEICYSKSGGDRFTKAEENAAKFIAQLLKEKGWGIDKVKKHQDFDGKYCPHRTLDMGWNRFLDMVRKELGDNVKPSEPNKPSKPSKKEKYTVGMPVCTNTLATSSTGGKVYKGDWEGTITRIEQGAKYPYLLNNGTGWTNDEGIDSDPHTPGTGTSKPSKKPDQILSVGSVVTSVAMKVAIPKGKSTAVDTINGDECIYVPDLGGYFPTRLLSEADASDGKKDNYFANTKTKVYVNQCTVEAVDGKTDMVKIHGIWVNAKPLTELKEGK